MLTYVSIGSRAFGDRPMQPYKRAQWEFYAVTAGRIAPLVAKGPDEPIRGNSLWLFPPGHEHGWIGEKGKKCRIVVFHFHGVPATLAAAVQSQSALCVVLQNMERHSLCRAARELQPHYWKPDALFEFRSQQVLMALTLLVLGKVASRGAPPPRTSPATRVLAAENWFREHLAEQLSVTNLARQVGTTEGHLRRLFLRERACTPKAMMTRVQLEHVAYLLRQSDLKLDAIATECGFASSSSLCQAFKHHHGVTPNEWRTMLNRTGAEQRLS